MRHVGEWPLPPPRRAPPGTELRRLQDGMPVCPDGSPPVLSGDGSELVMLIGQAPGRLEAGLGLPFAGDAGKRLVGWLGLVGVGVDDFRQGWYVSSIGKCYPGRAAGASADLPPSRADIELWSGYLVEELRLVAPRVVVLVGALAHRFAFGPQPLDQLVGRALEFRGAAAICLPHPSGASTWLNSPDHAELWRRSLGLLGGCWRDLGTSPRA